MMSNERVASLMLSDDEGKTNNRVGIVSSACVSTVTPHTGDWAAGGGTGTTPSSSSVRGEDLLKRRRGMDFTAGEFQLSWLPSTDSEGVADDDSPWHPSANEQPRKRGAVGDARHRKRRRREATDDDFAGDAVSGVPKENVMTSKVNLAPMSVPANFLKKPPAFLPFGLMTPELYPSLSLGGAPGSKCLTSHLMNPPVSGDAPDVANTQDQLPVYQCASQAPGRLPAHKPVRLKQPKHPLAPPGSPVFFKYGEEHYPEETVPDVFTCKESDGTVCRYITNFLVYNKRGERLLPIEVLDQPRHGALVLYGSLLPSETIVNTNVSTDSSGRSGVRPLRSRIDKRRGSIKRRGDDDNSTPPPYPVRVELSEWCIDYGQSPQNVPFIWLISRWENYYRLEKPAGRYIPTFGSAKLKFEVCTRVIKCLQLRPEYSYKEMVDLLTASSRQERTKRRLEEQRRRRRERQRRGKSETLDGSENDGSGISRFCSVSGRRGGELDEDGNKNKKPTRPNWKVTHSLATPEGTGVRIEMPEGREQPRTPWGAPFAVEGVTASTLLGLTEFLETQLRNFLDGVGGECPNLLETPLMQTLRDKASLRRETLQLVEAKKRALENMASATSYPHLPSAAYEMPTSPPPPSVAVHIQQPAMRHALPATTPVTQGVAMPGPLVCFGFVVSDNKGFDPSKETTQLALPSLLTSHHPALVMLKTRHQEEQELGQLLRLLREFSDPDCEAGAAEDESDDSLAGEEEEADGIRARDAVSSGSENIGR
eukprot:Gregarina_sp_Poly_1__632@NODE_114_length_13862_cov_162_782240_g101_i0_p2_GENE_NODE_114_length_13862_cov_162_782240_g101_i0NODE_114_length_13862_cov_162_782240_g101_i0_p2_ORF_typecomplete_len765_score128_84DNMT1RFD/PF12047_8/1_6e16DNMT1RFD/PF12047_8/5_9e03_NODE_114_length_13862_cov_162_782240_g101_i062908584